MGVGGSDWELWALSLVTDEAGKGSRWGQYLEPFGLYSGLQWTRGQEPGMGVLRGASMVWRGAFHLEPAMLARLGF